MKEELFSKFKDYNNELEKILEKKDFSKDSKNLLLSMFYKLESSYDDYQTVKRRVKTKQEYLENILNNIKQCNQIQLIKSIDPEFTKWEKENKKYEVDLKLKRIKVIENEIALLSAILELNDFRIYLREDYNLIRNSFPYLLNTANDMNQTEVVRDFNAFSWNTVAKDIQNIPANIVYENLKMALTIDIIEELEHSYINEDILAMIENNMKAIYEEKAIKKFLSLIFKISIMIYLKESREERKRLSEEQAVIKEELEFMKDKKLYIEDCIQKKQELSNNLKELELILNDKKLLNKEYERRNQSLSEYHKIFSLSHLTEKLQREKKKILKKIEECNKKLEPKNYVENKQKLQNDFNLLKKIDFVDLEKNEKLLYTSLKELQLLFLTELLPKKIEKLETKEELIDLVYEIRYYLFMVYQKEKMMKDITELKEPIEHVIHQLLKKLYNLKIINTLSTSEENDILIVSHLFTLRMITLEDIYLEIIRITKDNDEYEITFYDDKDTIEETRRITLKFNKKDRIKLKRKIKLF